MPFTRNIIQKRRGENSKEEMQVLGYNILDFQNFTKESIGKFGQPPELHHGLDQVLFEKGVHFMHSDRFPVYLKKIIQPEDIEMNRMDSYIIASKDDKLLDVAKSAGGVKFVSSTSSIIPFVRNIYSLFSGSKKYNCSELPTINMKSIYPPRIYRSNFSLTRLDNGIWAFTYTSESDETILSILGNPLEKFLTQPYEEFLSSYVKNHLTEHDNVEPSPNSYNYQRLGNVLVRSQLDAMHPAVGTFDIKTRASFGVRHNIENRTWFHQSRITSFTGNQDSFEKEYLDLIRTCFLKYSLQAKLGEMDGIFISYHNTLEFFGFEYLKLEEMENTIYETPQMADISFKVMFSMFSKIMEKILDEHSDEDTKEIKIETFAFGKDALKIIVNNGINTAAYTLSILNFEHDQLFRGHFRPHDENVVTVMYRIKNDGIEKKIEEYFGSSIY
eukprot:TRINITY_DN12811_c0_g1_i1.p1 TRINITY_DN12811_c0_g1~~TRINITY_DN12811_c0_g1_i1.p1  ORF type:complete len:482 (+),score=100.49 TRINITY_DN12811_c0_g1_i1:118-1446(+)